MNLTQFSVRTGVNDMIARKTKMLCVVLGSVVFTTEAYPCSIIGAISNLKLVNDADTIVRATAGSSADAES